MQKRKGWIDTEIVSSSYSHTNSHYVEYYAYHDERDHIYIPEDPEKEFGAIRRTPICFASLRRELREKSSGRYMNRILYRVTETKNSVNLSSKEKRMWIKIARKNLLLPPYVSLATARDGKMVLNIENSPPALIYSHLAALRLIREDPGFIRAMVYLVTEHKVNFYAAFVLCHGICLSHSGHGIISYYRRYLDSTEPEEANLPIYLMIGLRRFLRDPTKYDKRATHDCSDYRCNKTIGDISKIKQRCKAKTLFDPNLVKAIEADSDKEAKKYLGKIKGLTVSQ